MDKGGGGDNQIDPLGELLDYLTNEELEELDALLVEETKHQLFIPNNGPQRAALITQADELFYGGAAGGGKTALLCGLAIQEHEKSLILRRQYNQLGGIWDECERILGNRDGLREQKKVWNLPNGARIDFGSIQHPKDVENYQGRPHDFIGLDEITQFTRDMYIYVTSWKRTAKKDQRCRVVVTGNPPMGAQGRWVIEYWAPWIDENHPNPAKQGELRWFAMVKRDGKTFEVECDGPDHIPEGATNKPISRTFIGAKVTDNPEYMASGYADTLAMRPEPLRSKLLEGRFDSDYEEDPSQIFPSNWCVKAAELSPDSELHDLPMTAIGVDVARGGRNNTVLSIKRTRWKEGKALAHYFEPLIVLPGIDTPDGKSVAMEIFKIRTHDAKVVVDAGGGYGDAVIAELEHQGVPVFGFNGAAKPGPQTSASGLKFYNLRAQAFWLFRECLDPASGVKVALPPYDNELFSEMWSIRYSVGARGIQVEKKTDIIERTGRSPDRADALVYAFYSEFSGLLTPKNLKRDVRLAHNANQQKWAGASRQREFYDRYKRR